MPVRRQRSLLANFRKFFVRGLAIVLPTVLTFWLLIVVFTFVDTRIAEPINRGVRHLITRTTHWPPPTARDFAYAQEHVDGDTAARWRSMRDALATTLGPAWTQEREDEAYREFLEPYAQRYALRRWWGSVQIASWPVMNLVGLIIAVTLIYTVGAILGSYIGHRLYARGEELFQKVPLLGRVYPAVKQITDFFVGDQTDARVPFNRVVAVQYPRKGVWSVGLVTGEPMVDLAEGPDGPLLTVFIPSSPTPFTGYVITVPKKDTLELHVSIEEALRFTISGGVVLPTSQRATDLDTGAAVTPVSLPGGTTTAANDPERTA